jgi:hypothetical protein
VQSNLDILPHTEGGGTRFGWSFLKSWKACRTKWYDTYLRPHPDGGTGTEPTFTGEALLLGSAVHKGLEAYYNANTGIMWSDEGRILSVHGHARKELRERISEMAGGEEEYTKLTAQADDMLTTYIHHWTETEPEYPTWKVALDKNGEPLVEREFELDLGYNGYVFTSKIDVVCVFQDEYLVPLEHKTVDVSRAGRLVQQFMLDGQASGQLWLLQQCYPHLEVGPLHLNMLVKRAKRDPFRREPISRQPVDLEVFYHNTVRTLKEIDDHVGEWRSLVQRGMDPDTAARVIFDSTPDSFQCAGNFQCAFYGACTARGHEEAWFRSHTRARTEGDVMKATSRE